MSKTYYPIKTCIEREDLECFISDLIEQLYSWAVLHNDREEWLKYKGTDLTLGEKAVAIILDDKKSIKIGGFKGTETPKYELSLERLLKGIALNATQRPWDCDLENYDSITCNCITQYAIYDEVIFE